MKFAKELIDDIVKVLRRRPVRWVHVSTGPGYVPRRSPIGSVRSPEQKGVTFDVGRNQQKRESRAMHARWRG